MADLSGIKTIDLSGIKTVPLNTQSTATPKSNFVLTEAGGLTNLDAVARKKKAEELAKLAAQQGFDQNLVNATTKKLDDFGVSDYTKVTPAQMLDAAGGDFETANKLFKFFTVKPEVSKSEINPASEVNTKQILDEVRAIDEAQLILNDIGKARKGTSIGPIYSKIFDSAVRQFSAEGREIPPSMFDALLTAGIAPEKVQKLRLLDQQIQRLFDYVATKSGKAITANEKGSILQQFPGIYETEDNFDKVLNKSFENIKQLKQEKLNFLKKSGLSEDQYKSYLTDPVINTDNLKKNSELNQKITDSPANNMSSEEIRKALGI